MTANGYARTLTTTFDLASRKVAITADGQTLTNSYDSAGRSSSIADSLLNSLGAGVGNSGYTYDASNNRSTMTFSTAGNSWTQGYNYDAGERLHQLVNGASILDTLQYDNFGRTSQIAYLDGTNVSYAYEIDDDLQTMTHIYNGASATLNYTSNGVHQLLTMGTSDATYLMKQPKVATSYIANNLNQYTHVGSATLSYDGNGNLTNDGTFAYQFDEENRLRQGVGNGQTVTYAYDPLNRRRSKTVNGTVTYFMYDGQNELAEMSATGVRQRFYLNGTDADSRAAMYDDAGGAGWLFYHRNHQGSVLFTSQYTTVPATDGTIHDQYAYGAYGEAASTASVTGNPIRYTGRYFDAETGLYYYRARYYSPQLGRFLQTDPIGSKDDANLYTYVGNDPLDKTDSTGEAEDQIEEIVVTAKRPSDTGSRARADRPNQNFREKIFGRAQKTGTSGHVVRSAREAVQAAKSSTTERVGLNQSLQTTTGDNGVANVRPDVTVVSKPDANGVKDVNVKEVPSKSQTPSNVQNYYQRALESLRGIFRPGVVEITPITTPGTPIGEVPFEIPVVEPVILP